MLSFFLYICNSIFKHLEKPQARVTSSSSVIEGYFAIGQTSKEDRTRVSEAEDRAAIWVHEGQQALNCCVDAAVNQDAAKTKYKKNCPFSTFLLEQTWLAIFLVLVIKARRLLEASACCNYFYIQPQQREEIE